MNLQLDHRTVRTEQPRPLWSDNLAWWVNCLAIERYWLYAGADLQFARGRREALLTAFMEELAA